MNIQKFKSRKEVSSFLKEKGIDTTNWSEEKWLSINKGQSEIHMITLAEAMWDAYNESKPVQLKAGEWHTPFEDKINLENYTCKDGQSIVDYMKPLSLEYNYGIPIKVQISTARCARVSYTVVGEEGKEHNYQKDIELHDKLSSSGHMSPFEHCARAMSDEEYAKFVKGELTEKDYTDYQSDGPTVLDIRLESADSIKGWCNNFRGFIQYRYLIENNG